MGVDRSVSFGSACPSWSMTCRGSRPSAIGTTRTYAAACAASRHVGAASPLPRWARP